MTTSPPVLEPTFLASQRARLVALRGQLWRTVEGTAGEIRGLDAAAQGQANESEDEAQTLNLAESDRLLASALAARLGAIERALAKLDEGTYGLSDVSGLPIPIARLRVMPDAVTTMAEAHADGVRPATAD